MARQENEYDEASAESTLGYGGMIVRGGIGWPMREADALAHAIPQWFERTDDFGDVIALCLAALQSEEEAARIAVLNAFARLAKDGRALPRRRDILRAVRAALQDAEPRVREAAAAALETLVGR